MLLVAVCGFVYELVIIALGTYLFGNSVFQVSIVLAAFVSSMGLGSLAAKPLLRRPAQSFVAVEAAVALSWHRFTGDAGEIVSIEHFGASAEADVLFPEFGFTTENVVAAARRSLAAAR